MVRGCAQAEWWDRRRRAVEQFVQFLQSVALSTQGRRHALPPHGTQGLDLELAPARTVRAGDVCTPSQVLPVPVESGFDGGYQFSVEVARGWCSDRQSQGTAVD